MIRRIDAHHHLWRYTAEEYGWIDDAMTGLQRDFGPVDLYQVILERSGQGFSQRIPNGDA